MRTASVLIFALLCLPIPVVGASHFGTDDCTSFGEQNLLVQVEGEGRPLVMLGGGVLGTANWQEHARRLSADYRVVRLQNLNVQYGLEGRPLPLKYSIRMESCAIGATLDSLGLVDPVDLVGFSLGALAVLDFALNHPERIRSLTLVEPPAVWVLDGPERQAVTVPLRPRWIDFSRR